jgi:hypothetical protein
MIEAPVGSDLQFNYATVSGEGRLPGQTLPWERVRTSRVQARTDGYMFPDQISCVVAWASSRR